MKKTFQKKSIIAVLAVAIGAISCGCPPWASYYWDYVGSPASTYYELSAGSCYNVPSASASVSLDATIDLNGITTTSVSYSDLDCATETLTVETVSSKTDGNTVTAEFWDGAATGVTVEATESDTTVSSIKYTYHDSFTATIMTALMSLSSVSSCSGLVFIADQATDVTQCLIDGWEATNGTSVYNPYSDTFYDLCYYDADTQRWYVGVTNGSNDGTTSADRVIYLWEINWYAQ